MGHYDLAKRIVEFYRERINDIRAITHRIYGGRGTMWAWEFPIGTGNGPTELVEFVVVFHRQAVCRRGHQAALHECDDVFVLHMCFRD